MPLKEENKKRSAQGSYVGPWAQIICPMRGCRFERKKKKRQETRAWPQQKEGHHSEEKLAKKTWRAGQKHKENWKILMTQLQRTLLQGGASKVHQTWFQGQERSGPILPHAEEVRTVLFPGGTLHSDTPSLPILHETCLRLPGSVYPTKSLDGDSVRGIQAQGDFCWGGR